MGLYRSGRPSKYNYITKKGTPPPPVVGEYRIRTGSGGLKYLGITNDLQRRMYEHAKKGNICDESPSYEWMAALPGTPYSEVRKHEQEKIKKYKPERNIREGGGGREPHSLQYYEYAFTDSKGNDLYGIQETGNNHWPTIKYALSRILVFILGIVLIVAIIGALWFASVRMGWIDTLKGFWEERCFKVQ